MFYIKLKVFGIFKDYLNEEIIIQIINDKTNLFDLKNILSEKYFINDLYFLNNILKKSVFSCQNTILSNDYILKSENIINLLPPFSGG